MSTALPNFTSEETWCGGHYEIEIELGVPSDERLCTALQRIWSHPSLRGCCLSRDQEPQAQVRVDPGQHALEGHLFGVATLPNGTSVPCGTYVCRLEGDNQEPPRDLLSFFVPRGALPRIQGKGAYPFGDADLAAALRKELDQWLVEIGRLVFEQVPFELALVGWEVDFPRVSAEAVRASGVPNERYDGYLWRTDEGLGWYPPTNLEIVRFLSRPKASTGETR
jgi:hypothetical protein